MDRDGELTEAACFCGWKEEEKQAERDGDNGEVIVVSPFLFPPVGLSRQELSWHVLDLYN